MTPIQKLEQVLAALENSEPISSEVQQNLAALQASAVGELRGPKPEDGPPIEIPPVGAGG